MANRNWTSGRRGNSGDYGRGYDRPFNNRQTVSPWQGNANNGGGNILPLGASNDAVSIASNLIVNFLQQQQQSNVPSLLDMPPVRRDFGNFDRGFGDRRPPLGRMGSRANQGSNFNRRFSTPGKRPTNQNFQQGNKNKTPKKPSDNKSANSKDDEIKEEDGEKTEENDDGTKKADEMSTPYDGIMSEFLQCHVCEKKMWDGRSFQNHVNGRAHNLMMDKNRESYSLTADAMRQELKIAEMKRGRHEKRDYYCAMCDLYAADASKHRLSLGHRRLKRYLHPTCNCCHKENATRIELDEHRLSPQHMKVMQEKSREYINKPKIEAMVIYTLEQEIIHVKYPKRRYGKDRDNFKTKQDILDAAEKERKQKEAKVKVKLEPVEAYLLAQRNEGTAGETGEVKPETQDEEMKDDGEAEEKAEETEVEPEVKEEEPKNYILDYQEDITDLTGTTEENVPIYDIELAYGKSFIGDFNCKQCKLCNKVLDSEETAEVHLKTWRHYKKFAELLRLKAGIVVKKEQKRTAGNDEEDIDSKRRKIEDGEKAEDDTQENEDEAMEAEIEDSVQNGLQAEVELDQQTEDSLLEDPQPEAVAEEPESAVAVEAESAPQETAEAQEDASPKKTAGRPRGKGRRGRH